jgi:thiamine-monophosphate kinase
LSLNEFEVIRLFFNRQGLTAPGVILGIGDDAAILRPDPGKDIVVAADVLNAGIHFPESTSARAVAFKALAVNLSDLAAMGATPSWFTLSLSLLDANGDWLSAFSSGLFEIADQYGITLVGGDTVRGPLSVGIQVMGQLPSDTGLKRSGAKEGDRIYVSGFVGDAALALQQIKQNEEPAVELRNRLDYPVPRVNLGLRLSGVANSCIDISDGLVADLSHILEASEVGATISTASLPMSDFLHALDRDTALRLALTGGDDYELCFTAPAEKTKAIETIGSELGLPISCIGEVTNNTGLILSDYNKSLESFGFNHFAR